MARRKRISENARAVTVLLTPAEELALQIIEARRRHRSEERDSPSEIVADALWAFLERFEGMPKEKVAELLPVNDPDEVRSNVREFPK